MTEEPTMATAEEAAQRVYAKNLKEKLQTGTPGHKSRAGHREYK